MASAPWEDFATTTESAPWDDFKEDQGEPWQDFQAAQPVAPQAAQIDKPQIPPDVEALSNPEQYFDAKKVPPWAEHAAQAAFETVSGFVPRTFGQVAQFLTPAASAPAEIKRTYNAVKDWISKKGSVEQVARKYFPESFATEEVEKTEPYSVERFRLGFQTIANVLMGAAVGKGLTSAKPIGGETADASRLREHAEQVQETGIIQESGAKESSPNLEQQAQGIADSGPRSQAVETPTPQDIGTPTEQLRAFIREQQISGHSYGIPEGMIEGGLNTEHPDIASQIERYTLNNDAKGITDAIKHEGYDAYHADLQRLLIRSYGGKPIPVARIEGYSGGTGKGTGSYVSVSTNPFWGKSAGKGQLKLYEIKPSDVVLAGNESEGELIVRRHRLQPLTESTAQATPARIISTAIKQGDEVLTGTAYNEPHDAVGIRHGLEDVPEESKGFLVQQPDGTADFKTRAEAAPIAKEAGQLKPESVDTKSLRSEDLVDPIRGTQADVAVAREAAGIDPYERELSHSWGQAANESRLTSERYPGYDELLAQSIVKKPRPVSDNEHVGLLRNWKDAEFEHRQAVEAVNNAPDATAKELAMDRLAEAKDKLQEAFDAIDKSGSAAGRGFNIRKMILKEFYTPEAMEARVRAAKGGKALTESELKKVTQLNGDMQSARLASTKAESQRAADARFADLSENSIGKKVRQSKPRTIKDVRDVIQNEAEAARQRILEKRGSMKWSRDTNPCIL